MEPYRRQPRDEKEREPEMEDNKAPIGERNMISGGLVARRSSKSLKKAYAREVNNVHSQFPPSKTPRYNKSDIMALDSPMMIR